MNPRGLLDDRMQFIKHKGQAIYVLDFSELSSKEFLLMLEMVRASIARHAPGSLLCLADLTGAHFDKEVATKVKEVLVRDRPYVKKSAWVGAESLPHVYYENFKTFSQRDLPVFKTRDEALDWLVADEITQD